MCCTSTKYPALRFHINFNSFIFFRFLVFFCFFSVLFLFPFFLIFFFCSFYYLRSTPQICATDFSTLFFFLWKKRKKRKLKWVAVAGLEIFEMRMSQKKRQIAKNAIIAKSAKKEHQNREKCKKKKSMEWWHGRENSTPLCESKNYGFSQEQKKKLGIFGNLLEAKPWCVGECLLSIHFIPKMERNAILFPCEKRTFWRRQKTKNQLKGKWYHLMLREMLVDRVYLQFRFRWAVN